MKDEGSFVTLKDFAAILKKRKKKKKKKRKKKRRKWNGSFGRQCGTMVD